MLSNSTEAQVCSRSPDRLGKASALVPTATNSAGRAQNLINNFANLLVLQSYAKISAETMPVRMEDTHSTAASGFRGLVVSIL